MHSGSCGVVNFKVSLTIHCGKFIAVETVILPNVPSTSVPLKTNWKHLLNIQLGDPDLGTPGSIDLILVPEFSF